MQPGAVGVVVRRAMAPLDKVNYVCKRMPSSSPAGGVGAAAGGRGLGFRFTAGLGAGVTRGCVSGGLESLASSSP